HVCGDTLPVDHFGHHSPSTLLRGHASHAALILNPAVGTRTRRASGQMPRGIFTKIRQGNPVKTSSDAVNPKPAAFIEGRF
ncbi:hypothetical protein, partial [Mesorhizobium sp.]|uniref:hypothetical protein n=1 Tax=Mesorhizobium sp. TaxID=1871066 RepID=UPI0025EF5A7A